MVGVGVVVLIHQKLLSGYLNFDVIKQIKTLKRSLVCFHKRILAGVQERKDIRIHDKYKYTPRQIQIHCIFKLIILLLSQNACEYCIY